MSSSPTPARALPTVTRAEVAKHNKREDAWIVIDDHVYDITKFAALHPGGEKLILDLAGTDQTKDFWGLHRAEVLDKYHDKLVVAKLKDAPGGGFSKWADLAPTPFGEPSHMRPKWASPYYTDDMKRFRMAVRAVLDRELRPWAEKAETSNEYPSKELFMRLGEEGILAAVLGEGKHLAIPPRLPGGIKPEQFTLWHTCIVHEEFGRLNTPGAADSIIAGLMISLPVILHFGLNDKARARPIIEDVILGRKRMVLAVTEPFAGSDVASIRLTATKSADGSHYLLNGVKKWITGGATADYFVTAARTGGPGAGGLTYFLAERGDGLETKQISTSYAKSAGTAYVVYEDVKVPVGMMVGPKENRGWPMIVANFTQERLLIVARMVAVMRTCLDECWRWAAQREVFGKSLLTQPVMRFKLGDMTARLEAVQAWYESIVFQMTHMDFATRGEKLAGVVALLKYETTRVGALFADQAPQVFGGRSITQSGMGKMIERYVRSSKFASILGGSEEILLDYSVRLALKEMLPTAKL